MTSAIQLAGRVKDRLLPFLAERRGAALIEFAFAVPIMVLLLLGTFDTARYVLLHQKLDRAASTMADLVSRPTSISQAQIDSMFSAAGEQLQPFDMQLQGRVIISSVSKAPGDVAKIDWQYEGGGALSVTSDFGSSGGAATLPDGFVLRDGENLIVAEIFFDYEPMFLHEVIPDGVVDHAAIRRPRRGDLSTLN
ncbi:MAG: pilus assembly protein [Kiloniellales bacterium]|nr:pilus assembly protein [Kiloniellales bacterium]